VKIAYLVNVYPMTSLTFVRREIRSLEQQGIEVLRFTIRPPDADLPSPADREEAARTRCILRQGPGRILLSIAALCCTRPVAFLRALRTALALGLRSHRGVLLHLAYLAEACVLFRWVHPERVQHVHAHFATNPAAVALLCHELGGPGYSFTVHGPHEFDMPALIGLRQKIERAAFTVAISSFGRSQLCRWARHEDWSKIVVVHCGLSHEILDAPLTDVPDNGRLVCVARLGEQKGHLLLVEAAGRLAAQGTEFELVLVGDGPMRGAVEALVRTYHLEGRVKLLGALGSEQVHQVIAGSRAMVLPSFAEGLPVVLMEAFAAGRPVVATAIAGTPELVRPGVNGWLVPAGSVEALVESLGEVLRTPVARLSEMGRRGAELVARDHDVDREAGRLAELFRRVVGEPSHELSSVA
jgi:glycosyltransferase involved in cell wall biosynthesis